MKQFLKIMLTVAPFCFVILAIIEIILANRLAGSGKAIRAVDIAIDSLRDQNKLLEQQVASASSLLTIEARAKDMGFVEPRTSQYMTLVPEQLPVAFNSTVK